jgi:hypothetical protein
VLGRRPAVHQGALPEGASGAGVPEAAREKRLQGTWAATCTFTRTGEVTSCVVERPVPELDQPFLEWIRAGPWQAPTLDGRAFGCEYRLEFSLSINNL